jgi:hypothetical protein
MTRREAGKCPHYSGQHLWRDISDKDDLTAGRRVYMCGRCGKEAVE